MMMKTWSSGRLLVRREGNSLSLLHWNSGVKVGMLDSLGKSCCVRLRALQLFRPPSRVGRALGDVIFSSISVPLSRLGALVTMYITVVAWVGWEMAGIRHFEVVNGGRGVD